MNIQRVTGKMKFQIGKNCLCPLVTRIHSYTIISHYIRGFTLGSFFPFHINSLPLVGCLRKIGNVFCRRYGGRTCNITIGASVCFFLFLTVRTDCIVISGTRSQPFVRHLINLFTLFPDFICLTVFLLIPGYDITLYPLRFPGYACLPV